MTDVLARPRHLPDFRSPPLSEVVLGVQFASPQGYQQIRAGEVWNLFKGHYPRVQEHQALPPAFETFGLPFQHSSMMPQFGFVTGGTHDRFWFLDQEGRELIQFQQDRLLHNWRKNGDANNEYPRFEAMTDKFRAELSQFQGYINSLAPQALSINQCEISYINHISFQRGEEGGFADWLKFLNFTESKPDDFTINFREVIKDSDGKPRGRLYVESALGYLPDGHEVIVLTLTVKGAPLGSDINSALEFLSLGREVIVQRFAELTTDQAHKKWERVN